MALIIGKRLEPDCRPNVPPDARDPCDLLSSYGSPLAWWDAWLTGPPTARHYALCGCAAPSLSHLAGRPSASLVPAHAGRPRRRSPTPPVVLVAVRRPRWPSSSSFATHASCCFAALSATVVAPAEMAAAHRRARRRSCP